MKKTTKQTPTAELKTGMKRISICLLFLSCAVLGPCTAYAGQITTALRPDTNQVRQAAQFIKEFYVAYTTDALSLPSHSDSIMKLYLTKGLIDKVKRMISSTGADPILRAQDCSESIPKSVRVKHLEKNWYMISYLNNYMTIPVRVTQIAGRWMIDYITPPWNNALYGDSLFFDKPMPKPIDASTPLSLVETFYAAYTMWYCGTANDATAQLAKLRTKHFTPNALSQFEAAAKESLLDGWRGYDLFIDGFDFDRLWLPSVKIKQVDKDTYQISYQYTEVPNTIQVKVVKQGKEYRIAGITK